jgi:hypothetical protein
MSQLIKWHQQIVPMTLGNLPSLGVRIRALIANGVLTRVAALTIPLWGHSCRGATRKTGCYEAMSREVVQ